MTWWGIKGSTEKSAGPFSLEIQEPASAGFLFGGRRVATQSEALREAYSAAPSNIKIMHTLEFRHPAFLDAEDEVTAARFVLDHADMVATLEATAPMNPGEAVTFTRMKFDFALPEQTDRTAVPEIIISIDNATRVLVPYLDQAIEAGGEIEVTYRAFLSNDLVSGPENDPPLTLIITQIDVTLGTVTARATFGDFSNAAFPAIDYDAVTFPGLATS